MEPKSASRRVFLQTALAGAAVAATAKVFAATAEPVAAKGQQGIWVCPVCGHLEFGSGFQVCPVCHTAEAKFTRNDKVFSDAMAKGPQLGEGHTPVITVMKQSALIPEMACQSAEVRVGKKIHPMTEAHYIRFIDCYVDDKHVTRIMLTLGVNPAAEFQFKNSGSKVKIVEWCNLHGYWQAEADMA